jgi:hypothetical protein
MGLLRPLLPKRYASLQPNGNGLQTVYLTELPETFAELLKALIGAEMAPIEGSAAAMKPVVADELDAWERKIERNIADDSTIPEAEWIAIIRARKGQGAARQSG